MRISLENWWNNKPAALLYLSKVRMNELILFGNSVMVAFNRSSQFT